MITENGLFRHLTVLIIFLFYSSGYASSVTFQKIIVNGLEKTHESVVMTELGFKTGDQIEIEQLELGINEIRNTELFSVVSYEILEKKDERILVITLQERWTTIPIFKLSSGGGVSQITLGLFDPNLFGKYLEAGSQYEKLGDTSSGVAWFKNPRINNSKYGLDFQIWKTNRIRTKYFQEDDDLKVKTGFLHKREKIFLGIHKELTPSHILRVFYEFNNDSFSDKLISDEVKLALVSSGGLPISTRFHFIGTGFDFGIINVDAYKFEGSLLELSLRYGLSASGENLNFAEGTATYRYFKTVLGDSTLAQRFMFGATDTKVLQYWHYLGGLDRIRGFVDNRFAGRFFWLSNSEFRYPFIKNNSVVVQSTAFIDLVSNGENLKNLDELEGASGGVGLRFFLPKIYKFTLRCDYAVPLLKNDKINFSFGFQQFF